MSCIPYMGSKRKLAYKIVECILEHNPDCKYIYDLFGGGGAVSLKFLQQSKIKKVIYNELNRGVCELLKKIQKDGVAEEFYDWVDRETFNKHKNDNTWFGGLVKTCWSFGNNQADYMFSKEIEEIKKAAHEYLLKNGYNKTAESRLTLIKQFINDSNIKDGVVLEQLQRLQRLEQLQQLLQLEQLERLEIQNKSYNEVTINTPINETIIYCDPPYQNTAKYQHDIDHAKFYNWVKNSKYKIYISSYEAPFAEVESFVHRSSLSANANNEVIEKLYCNQVEKIKRYLDFS